MAFCTQCGQPVGAADRFCAKCGAFQPGAEPLARDFLAGLSPRTAAILCYVPVLGWIAAIAVLASQRFRQDRDTRFHAFQGLYLFVAWLILDWVIGPMMNYSPPGVFQFKAAGLLKAVLIGVSVFMMVKTSQRVSFRLPIFGELAERSLSEQR